MSRNQVLAVQGALSADLGVDLANLDQTLVLSEFKLPGN